ncbi:MAG: hypothetical protein AB7O24_02725 [Kofleriaceae bacterium]
MSGTRAWLVTLAMVTGPSAFAQDPEPVGSPDPDPDGSPDPAPSAQPVAAMPAPVSDQVISPKGKLSASLRLGMGVRALVPYDEIDYCGDTDPETATGNAPVCTGRAPFSLDLELSYGVTDSVEVLLELRLGLERDFPSIPNGDDGPRNIHVSPGGRLFFGEGARSKLFSTGQLVFDFSGYDNAAGESLGSDFGVRNLNGLWFDLHPRYSVYGYVGETATFSRWMRFELEAGIGVQGRLR